jgi:hypothetical protein
MATGFTAGSQGSVIYGLDSVAQAGTTVTLTSSDGTRLASVTATKEFQSVVVSAPGMEEGGTYTLSVGDASYEFTLDDAHSTEGSSGMGGSMGTMGGGAGGLGGGTAPSGNVNGTRSAG